MSITTKVWFTIKEKGREQSYTGGLKKVLGGTKGSREQSKK